MSRTRMKRSHHEKQIQASLRQEEKGKRLTTQSVSNDAEMNLSIGLRPRDGLSETRHKFGFG